MSQSIRSLSPEQNARPRGPVRFDGQEHDYQRARALAAWKQKVRAAWRDVQVTRVDVTVPEKMRVGQEFQVRAWIRLGTLSTADVLPQVYLGKLRESRAIVDATIVPMSHRGPSKEGALFQVSIPSHASGTHGLTVRVVPSHEDLGHPHEMGLIAWASIKTA